jgi:GntR family transcriptional regulator of gluconate operon
MEDLASSAREHTDLAALIAAGKVPKVKAELHRHLQTTCSRLQSAVPPAQP